MTTTLEESARLAGSHAWLERRLFEITGGWVTTTAEPEAKLMLDRHSHHHSWRAEQWVERLPVLADVDRAALAATADPDLAPALAALERASDTPARLAGLYRFALPRLWGAYHRHLSAVGGAAVGGAAVGGAAVGGAAGGIADGSTLRTLGIVIPDVTSDWQEGEALLQNLLVSREAVAQAVSTVGDLEAARIRA